MQRVKAIASSISTATNLEINYEMSELQVTNWINKIKTSIAASKATRGWNYIQVASCGRENLPTNRTVVFRGWQHDYRALKFTTDKRSQKFEHFVENPLAEVVWWFPQTGEQYRLRGKIQLITSDEKDLEVKKYRAQTWREHGNKQREAFFMPGPHLKVGPEYQPDRTAIPKGGKDETGSIVEPPATFVLVFLWIEHVKYLKIPENFAQQSDYGSKENWVTYRITP